MSDKERQQSGLAARLRQLHVEVAKAEWKLRPEVLCHVNIPKPMHGLAPRVVLGGPWWRKTRLAAYASTDFHCVACGVSKYVAAYHKWLEGHEMYAVDYVKGRMKYLETVPLCHACHCYIHSGRMEHLLQAGQVTERKYRDVRAHGARILRAAGITAPKPYPGPFAPWGSWRLVIGRKHYPPLFASEAELAAHHNPIEE
jgi:hypothetical protein